MKHALSYRLPVKHLVVMSHKKNLIPADDKTPFFTLVISVNIAQLFTFHRHTRRVVW